jgi:hypothetical protein
MLNIISVLHALLVMYIVILPICPNVTRELVLLHIALISSILFHWALNNDVCALTLLEQRVYPDTPKEDLFMQRLVSPVYTVTNKDIRIGTYMILLVTIMKYYLTKWTLN